MTIYALNGQSPTIDPSAWVAPDANVIAQVTLGAEVTIWFGCTLRGDNEPITIGAGSNLQENVVCHTDPGFPLLVGQGCTIGHKAMLHGCTIGDNTLVGMGATILNGARIGANCLIGAGALIPEGKEIPEGSLVMGMPGKVVRQIDQAGWARMRASAEAYRLKAREYREGLTAL